MIFWFETEFIHDLEEIASNQTVSFIIQEWTWRFLRKIRHYIEGKSPFLQKSQISLVLSSLHDDLKMSLHVHIGKKKSKISQLRLWHYIADQSSLKVQNSNSQKHKRAKEMYLKEHEKLQYTVDGTKCDRNRHKRKFPFQFLQSALKHLCIRTF